LSGVTLQRQGYPDKEGPKGIRHTSTVGNSFWPLFDLRVRTPRLEIRLPTDEDLLRLIEVIERGIHDPATMPFLNPFTDTPPPEGRKDSLQWWWSRRANWSPDDWCFNGAVVVDGMPVGVQDLMAKDFPALRTVKTGSWLGREFQGQGLGKEMRAAILHLAFAGLGALEAHSGAFHDNEASLATSRSLGYAENGDELALRRGQPDRVVKMKLDRASWLSIRRDDIEIEGIDLCIDMFGLDGSTGSFKSVTT
jgi:RimJ/RimL family protein N-acetyltransferase